MAEQSERSSQAAAEMFRILPWMCTERLVCTGRKLKIQKIYIFLLRHS